MRNGIKKYVIASIPIIFGCLFGISNGYNLIENCYTYSNQTYNCEEFEPNELVSFGFENVKIDGNLDFSTNNGEITQIFATKKQVNSNTYSRSLYWNNGRLTFVAGNTSNGNNNVIREYSGACVGDSNVYSSCQNIMTENPTGLTNIDDIYTAIQGKTLTKIYYNHQSGTYQNIAMCFVYGNDDYGFCVGLGYYTTNPNTQSFRLITSNIINSNIIINASDLYDYINTNSSLTLSNSPIQGGSNGGGETTIETTPVLGQCPTVREILSTYGNDYNTGICYSATRLLTQTGIISTTAQSIFELYPTFTDWLQDYNYYKQYCDNVPTSVCREAFSGNEIKWSLLNKTPQDNPIAIYQYCHLQLNIQDKNATTCVLNTGAYYATGVDEAIEEEIQKNQSVLDIMLNSFNNLKDELPSFSTGTVFDEFLEEGETWKDGFKLDIFKTFLELWSKITSIFIFRHQYDGIIPTYITSIIMIILLFKILKK